jgi:hypothetical protein
MVALLARYLTFGFFGNGTFKSQMEAKHYTTMRGMLRAARKQWTRIPLDIIQRALDSWSGQVLAIYKNHGRQFAEY